MRVAREAWALTLPVAIAAVGAWALGWTVLASTCLLLAGCVLMFFRDPHRQVPDGPDLLVSSADGKIVGIGPTDAEPGERPQIRVSIFLSIFDVHINRAPVAGQVRNVRYTRGAFLPAFNDKASERNEQNRIEFEDGSRRLAMVQIAGLIARRIVCRASPGDWLQRGQRLGLIKFGSRVDLYLPETVELYVQVGDRVRGGSSVIGRLVGNSSDATDASETDEPASGGRCLPGGP